MIRVGSYKGHWHGPAHVLTGGISGFHPRKGLPYTIRERARLQGFPDDFAFHGTVYSDEEGQRRWNHDKNMHMIRQTGKAMPIQFCQYVSEQIADCIQHGPEHWAGDERATNTRVIQSNEHVDEAKRWYCANVGYSAQERACGSCQLARGCDIREAKRIPMPANPARLVGVPARPGRVSLLETDPGEAGASPRTPKSTHKPSKNKGLTPARTPRVVLKDNGTQAKSKTPPRTYRDVPTAMLDFGGKK